MLYNVGGHDSDELAERACYDAGLGRSGIGGDAPPPEPGVYYFPLVNGLPTGWPRVWGMTREGDCANDYEWIDMNPTQFVKHGEINQLLNEPHLLRSIVDQLLELKPELLKNLNSNVASPSVNPTNSFIDIDYHPMKGPDSGPDKGAKLKATIHGQIARQWQPLARQVRFWIAKGCGDATEWWLIKS